MSDEDQGAVNAQTTPDQGIFDESRDDELHKELSAVYDKSHSAVEKAQELQVVPAIVPADNVQSAMEKTWDFLHASPKEQATQRDASKLVEQVRDNAARFGIQLSDAEAMDKALALEQMQAQEAKSNPTIPAELQPAVRAVQQLYPGRNFHEVAADYAKIDSDFKRDPLNVGFRMLQEQTGLSPLEIARQVAMAHSPQETQMFHAQREAEVIVNAFIAAYPDVSQEAIVEALSKFPRSGNMAADMAKACEMAGQKPSRPSRKGERRSMESEMEETYRRVNRR